MKINQHTIGDLSIDIAPCTIADIDDMMRLFEESIRNSCVNDYTQKQIDAWIARGKNKARWHEKFKLQYFIKAIVHNKLIGFASLEAHAYFDFLYVQSTSQKSGVASLLAEHIEHKARRQATPILKVHASETAMPFFLKRGYILLAKNEFLIGDISIHNYEMNKLL